jgi:hypothetical protein
MGPCCSSSTTASGPGRSLPDRAVRLTGLHLALGPHDLDVQYLAAPRTAGCVPPTCRAALPEAHHTTASSPRPTRPPQPAPTHHPADQPQEPASSAKRYVPSTTTSTTTSSVRTRRSVSVAEVLHETRHPHDYRAALLGWVTNPTFQTPNRAPTSTGSPQRITRISEPARFLARGAGADPRGSRLSPSRLRPGAGRRGVGSGAACDWSTTTVKGLGSGGARVLVGGGLARPAWRAGLLHGHAACRRVARGLTASQHPSSCNEYLVTIDHSFG